MKYILEGNPQVLENVIREQRIRIQRGAIKVTPLSQDEEADTKPQAEANEEGKKGVEEAQSGKAVETESPEDEKNVEPTDDKSAPEADTKSAKTKKK